MPRRPRNEEAGAIHHVFARGVAKRPIYRNRADRELYLSMLAGVVRRFGWECLAYCQMENHVHLLIRTPEPNLGRGMQALHGDYAAAFNARHGLSGHVFQGRYGSVRITSDPHLWVAAAYIANNPVDARIVPRPEDWAWSSHRAAEAGEGPWWLALERLYEYFGAFGGDGRERYCSFVGPGAKAGGGRGRVGGQAVPAAIGGPNAPDVRGLDAARRRGGGPGSTTAGLPKEPRRTLPGRGPG